MSGFVGYGNTPIKIISGADTTNIKEWLFDSNGNIRLPLGGNVLNHEGGIIISEGIDTGNIVFENDTISNDTQGNSIYIQTSDVGSTSYSWVFGQDGTLTIPPDGKISQSFSLTKSNLSEITSAAPTVVWSSDSSTISSVKLLIQLEQEQVGDPTGFHTHTCEAIISARGTNQIGTPSVTVFAVNYTYTSSLVTFTVQRNIDSGLIEVVATLVDGTNPAYLSIHSIEQLTRGLFIL